MKNTDNFPAQHRVMTNAPKKDVIYKYQNNCELLSIIFLLIQSSAAFGTVIRAFKCIRLAIMSQI